MKSIYQYTNYRLFLKDYYEEKKATEGYTYRDFSKAADMNSPSWLKQLIEGGKNLSKNSLPRVENALGLSGAERAYFKLMVAFTQAAVHGEKDQYYQQIIGIKKKLKLIQIEEKHYDFYSKWYYPVIRSLVSKVDFGENYSLLARKVLPPIKPHEARKAMNYLKKNGFIHKNDQGKWTHSEAFLSTGDEVNSLHVINYHKEMLQLAIDAHDRISKHKRDISSLTLGVGDAEFEIIKSRVQTFRKEILQIAKSSKNADRVYQFNLQLFPVSLTEDAPHEK